MGSGVFRFCRVSSTAALLAGAAFAALETRAAGAGAPSGTTESGWSYPVGDDNEGLPRSGGPLPAYRPEAEHPLNRLHALLFLAPRIPTELGATLPAERRRSGRSDAEFFQGRWALENRKQIDTVRDARTFGGDVRTSPVERWTAEQGAEARAILAGLATPAACAAALPSPVARLSLQWDLLQVWWRFERDGGADDATLLALARTIRSLGQPRDTLAALPSGLDSLAGAGSATARDRRLARIPVGLTGGANSDWVEVDRESKSLFQAQRSLCSARAFVRSGDRARTEALVLAAANQSQELIDIPRETEVALLLGMVGLTGELEPVATPVISELRLRLAVAPDVLDPASDTSTRDGWNHWVWLYSRIGTTAAAGEPTLRFVPDTAQSLFLEYGSPKHTTYFAQCALCHRTANGGKQNPSGIHVLGRYAKPSVLADPAKRLRDAEREMAPLVARLRARLGGS